MARITIPAGCIKSARDCFDYTALRSIGNHEWVRLIIKFQNLGCLPIHYEGQTIIFKRNVFSTVFFPWGCNGAVRSTISRGCSTNPTGFYPRTAFRKGPGSPQARLDILQIDSSKSAFALEMFQVFFVNESSFVFINSILNIVSKSQKKILFHWNFESCDISEIFSP